MKLFLRAALIITFLASAASATEGTYIYKGTSSVYDPFDGKTHSQPLYFVIGDEVAQGGSTSYFVTKMTFVEFDGAIGKKKYVQDADLSLQDVQFTLSNNKVVEVYSYGAARSGPDFFETLLLRGNVSEPTKFLVPIVLSGNDIMFQYNAPLYNFALRTTYTLHLDKVLTSTSNAHSDKQADAVARAIKVLTDKGYTL